jgi:ribosomal protein S18 acetylase RimI-like enzyme
LTIGESYLVRPSEPEDLDFLWEMLYEAAHRRSLSDPAISRYLEDWGRPGDAAVMALNLDNGRRIGATWYRLMPPGNRRYGFVDASPPEVVIAVAPDRRGVGVGGALLRSLLGVAKSQGFDALSLSVRCNNPAAIRLYERNGFIKLFDINSEYPSWAMKVDFTAHGKDEGPRRTEAPVSNKSQG